MKHDIRPPVLSRSERRVAATLLMIIAATLTFVAMRAPAPSTATTITVMDMGRETARAMGTFATEKLLVTSTANDSIVSSGGAQMTRALLAASTTSSATAERLLLKSTNAANDRSSIQWLDSTDTHKWALGNQVAFDLTEQSFFLYDWTNAYYPMILRDGNTLGRISYVMPGIPAHNGGFAFDRSTEILSLRINATGGSAAGGERVLIDVNSRATVADNGQLAWANSTNIYDPVDLAIGRTASNAILEVNNGTPGTVRPISTSQVFLGGGPSGVTWVPGAGTPEGSVTAPVSSLYSRTDGGAGTSLYVKESGVGNTGWTAIATAGTVTGTTNTMAKFTGTNAVGNSLSTDDGTTVKIGGAGKLEVNTALNTLDWSGIGGSSGGFLTMLADGSLVIGNSGGVPASNFLVAATTGNVTMSNGNLSLVSGQISVGSGNVVIAPGSAGTVTAGGAITADGGLRVFDIAGAGLTSSANTVNAVAATGGGLTVNANDIQMTFCAANEVPKMNAGGTAWACGTAGTGTIGGSISADGVVYASAANTAATDQTAFAYYAAGDILNIGTTAVTNCGAGACSGITLAVSSGTSGATPVYSWNTNTAGYGGYAWNNSSSVQQGSMGFANSAVSIVGLRNLNFFSSQGADYVFYETTSSAGAGSAVMRIGMTAGSASQQWTNGSSAAVSSASTGKLIYNNTTKTFRASLDGGAYADVITGAVTANTIPKSASSTTGALTASTITDNGTTVAINTNKLTVTVASGNTDIAGTLNAVGNITENSVRVVTLAGSGLSKTGGTLKVLWGWGTPTTSANCTLTAGGIDSGGRVTLSSGTDCTLTFGETAPATPLCQMYDCSAAFNVVSRNPNSANTTSATWTGVLDTQAAGWCYKCSGGRNTF